MKPKKQPPAGMNPLYTIGKMAPADVPSERAVLGALLVDRNSIITILPLLTPDSFSDIRHQLIFEASVSLFRQKVPIDLVTLNAELSKTGHVEQAGGIPYLLELSQLVASSANIEYHASIIQERAIGRGLISVGHNLVKDGHEDTTDYLGLLQKVESEIFRLAKTLHRKEVSIIDDLMYLNLKTIDERQKSGGGITGVNTGFHELNEITGGLQGGELIVIAGRPAMGKTAFVLALARNASIDHNTSTAVFSLEMNSESLSMRLLSAEAEVDSTRIRNGRLNESDWKRITDSSTRLSNSRLFIDDTPSLSVQEFRSKCKRLYMEKNVRLIIIDYIQLMSSGEAYVNNREQEVSFISRTLKLVAKELNIPVVALSQLSRQVENRKDNRPMLSDLRESGAIEQDADIVGFLYRPEYYNIMVDDFTGENTQGVGYLIIAKNRNGDTGQVKMRFAKEFTKFTDYTDYYNGAPQMEPIQKFAPSAKYEKDPWEF